MRPFQRHPQRVPAVPLRDILCAALYVALVISSVVAMALQGVYN